MEALRLAGPSGGWGAHHRRDDPACTKTHQAPPWAAPPDAGGCCWPCTTQGTACQHQCHQENFHFSDRSATKRPSTGRTSLRDGRHCCWHRPCASRMLPAQSGSSPACVGMWGSDYTISATQSCVPFLAGNLRSVVQCYPLAPLSTTSCPPPSHPPHLGGVVPGNPG